MRLILSNSCCYHTNIDVILGGHQETCHSQCVQIKHLPSTYIYIYLCIFNLSVKTSAEIQISYCHTNAIYLKTVTQQISKLNREKVLLGLPAVDS